MDYEETSVDLPLMVGDERRCVGIVILADSIVEEDKTFDVIIEEFGISTTVTILDDGNFKIQSYNYYVSTNRYTSQLYWGLTHGDR